MTLKHFEALASALKVARPPSSFTQARIQWQADLRALCDAFYEINPNFNRSRFLDACGFDD